MLQRCMKHAHIITHSSTHAVCLLLFTRKWGARPGTACRLAPDKVAEEFTVCCHCYGTVSCRIAVSSPKFNYHLRLLAANTPPLFRACCACLCARVRARPSDSGYVILIFQFFFLSLKTSQFAQFHVITSSTGNRKHLADISSADLRVRRRALPSWVIDHVI